MIHSVYVTGSAYVCLLFNMLSSPLLLQLRQAWYCCSCASVMAAPCAKWYVALQPRSTLFSGFLRSVAFLPQAFRSQSIGFRRSRRAPSPTLLCDGAMRSGQLFSVRIVRRFTLGALHLHKCWISLCWCTKYRSKDNLPLPLLARKRNNRQSDGETIGKAAVRQSWHITPFLHNYITHLHARHVLCAMRMLSIMLLVNQVLGSNCTGLFYAISVEFYYR